MLNTEYKTIFFNKPTDKMLSLLNDLCMGTSFTEIEWKRKWNTVLNMWYYHAEAPLYDEEYSLYVERDLGTVLQITNNKEKLNYELDDSVFKNELTYLKEAICEQRAMEKYSENDILDEYDYNMYNSCYTNTSQYMYDPKADKKKKAQRQLSEVDGSRNSERL